MNFFIKEKNIYKFKNDYLVEHCEFLDNCNILIYQENFLKCINLKSKITNFSIYIIIKFPYFKKIDKNKFLFHKGNNIIKTLIINENLSNFIILPNIEIDIKNPNQFKLLSNKNILIGNFNEIYIINNNFQILSIIQLINIKYYCQEIIIKNANKNLLFIPYDKYTNLYNLNDLTFITKINFLIIDFLLLNDDILFCFNLDNGYILNLKNFNIIQKINCPQNFYNEFDENNNFNGNYQFNKVFKYNNNIFITIIKSKTFCNEFNLICIWDYSQIENIKLKQTLIFDKNYIDLIDIKNLYYLNFSGINQIIIKQSNKPINIIKKNIKTRTDNNLIKKINNKSKYNLRNEKMIELVEPELSEEIEFIDE